MTDQSLTTKVCYVPRFDCLLIWHYKLWLEAHEETPKSIRDKLQEEVYKNGVVIIGDYD